MEFKDFFVGQSVTLSDWSNIDNGVLKTALPSNFKEKEFSFKVLDCNAKEQAIKLEMPDGIGIRESRSVVFENGKSGYQFLWTWWIVSKDFNEFIPVSY